MRAKRQAATRLCLVHGPPPRHRQHKGGLVAGGGRGSDAEPRVPAPVDALAGVLEVQLHALRGRVNADLTSRFVQGKINLCRAASAEQACSAAPRIVARRRVQDSGQATAAPADWLTASTYASMRLASCNEQHKLSISTISSTPTCTRLIDKAGVAAHDDRPPGGAGGHASCSQKQSLCTTTVRYALTHLVHKARVAAHDHGPAGGAGRHGGDVEPLLPLLVDPLEGEGVGHLVALLRVRRALRSARDRAGEMLARCGCG